MLLLESDAPVAPLTPVLFMLEPDAPLDPLPVLMLPLESAAPVEPLTPVLPLGSVVTVAPLGRLPEPVAPEESLELLGVGAVLLFVGLPEVVLSEVVPLCCATA